VKFPHLGEFRGDLNGGNGMECQGVVVCLVTLIDARGDPSLGACVLGLTMVAMAVVEMGGEIPPVWEIWWTSRWGE
jgi:hypothetical protein